MVAQAIFETLSTDDRFETELKNMVEVMHSNELEEFDYFIIATSTWGEAEYPPDAEDFMNVVTSNHPNIEGKKAAFFGLGETAYENFCSSIKLIRTFFLEELKVKEAGEIKYIDGYPDDAILEEMKEWGKRVANEFVE
jgi:flavodoxin I